MAPTFVRTLARPTSLGVLSGVTVAAAALSIDVSLDLTSWIATGNARALLSAAFGAVVTAGAFSFWLRPVAAQLASSTVPPRLMAGHLYDRFQRRVVGVTVGVLAFLALVLLSLPDTASRPAPLVATVVGALSGVGAIASLLVSMRHAERSTRPSVVLAETANEVIDHIELSAVDEPLNHSALPDGTPARILAPVSGWVSDVQHARMLEIAPEGATVRLDADVGAFVIAGWTCVASVWPADHVDAGMRHRLARSVDIEDERSSPYDLEGSLSQFVDVGVQAATGGASSSSTIYETMWWLGAILHELTRHLDVGFSDVRLDDGRTLVRKNRLSTPQLAELAVDRIRQVTASQPEMALELTRVVLDAEQAARDAARPELAAALRSQADLVVEQCRRGGGLPADIDRVVRAHAEHRGEDRTGVRADQ